MPASPSVGVLERAAVPSRVATRLARLESIARSRRSSHPGALILPHLALRTRGRSPVTFARAYFRNKIEAAFASPLAADFEFESEQPTTVRVASRDRDSVVAAIQDELDHHHWYLSNFLTHPRYGSERQVGFTRGDTLAPVDLREVKRGVFSFRVRGIAVGRRDLLKQIAGPNRSGPKPPPVSKPPAGWSRIFITIPTKPDAAEVGDTEWYDFNPVTWLKRHPTIPLRPAIPIALRARPEQPLLLPDYARLYHSGLVRIAFLFGYDDEGHNTTRDARDCWKVLVAPHEKRFTKAKTGQYGYHGPGLGFADPTGGHFSRLNLDGTSVFQRGPQFGSGPVRVRYTLREALTVGGRAAPARSVRVDGRIVEPGKTVRAGAVIERDITVEVRLFNFDKSSRQSSERLVQQFVSVFGNNDVILYDGHANYGGGFYIGEQASDILWASDIGSYRHYFSSDYQVFAIGACHAAGYFADLFYNELHPRKSPRNLDISAAVNETSFADAVHQCLAFVRGLLQLGASEPPTYPEILLKESRPAAFQSYIGVFGEPSRQGRK
jgi:hypothetical protein